MNKKTRLKFVLRHLCQSDPVLSLLDRYRDRRRDTRAQTQLIERWHQNHEALTEDLFPIQKDEGQELQPARTLGT